jgi:hypothetical protein
MRRKRLASLAILASLAAGGWMALAADKDQSNAPATLTLEGARREVRLLDDLYKSAIVYMNEVYVEDENSVAAGETARDLFAAMKQKGWHDARLVDATGEPINSENEPRDAFEKAAIEKIRGGQPYYDEVVSENDGRYLRAATLVPVVNDKCVLCHPGNKVGDVLGAISYKIPIK